MDRRSFIAAFGTLLAGCSETPISNSNPGVGDTITRNEIAVTPTDARTANSVKLQDGDLTIDPSIPSNATVGLVKLRTENSDITSREIPTVNVADYTDMSSDESALDTTDNDIRVYGGDEGGHLPSDKRGQITKFNHETIVARRPLDAYPVSLSSRESLSPNSSVSGWVFGVIPKGEPVRVRVTWEDESTIWNLGGETRTVETTTQPDGTIIPF